MKRRFKIEEVGLPDLAGMMLATVEALKAIGGSANNLELDEKVAEVEGVSEAEQSFMMVNNDDLPRLKYYLSWARTYLKRGGVLDNSTRGVWALTPSGANISTISETRQIYDEVQQEERERARLKRLAKKESVGLKVAPTVTDPDLTSAPDGGSDVASVEWREELIAVVRRMDPSAFERLAQRLLREAGFTKVEVRGKSGDGGIDGIGVLRVNLVSFQVFLQCKRYKGSVGASDIRDFRGAMQGRADKGLFITTGTFTAQASDEATRDGATAIDLIDGERLCDLLKENGLGVSTRSVEVVDVDATWFDGI